MAGTEGASDLAVILGSLVGVLDHQADRGSGRDGAVAVIIDAGQDTDLIGLLSLGDEAAAAGLAQIQPGLDIGFSQRDQRRTAVDDAADGGAVAFAPGGDAEQVAEGVVRHDGEA